jgi:ATP-dependent exoDNAse (exonuclease V) beta subunit
VPPDAVGALDDADRRVIEQARRFVPAWIERVDRIPPSALLEQILVDTAYAYELRGARRLQAWENIKKMRGLVRRMQNRGYATLSRLTAHLDSLGAGDESNAVLEAVDAVNLMTVHASKGLEFPVVFLVNLARGASGPPRPVRVMVNGDDTAVSVGPFASEMEEAERERDKHETRRLLYVAMTRARDRLYLSTSLKDGALQPGRGSLVDVLPESLKRLFEHAGTALDGIARAAWRGASGTTFEWRICSPRPDGPAVAADRGPQRSSVTSWLTAGVRASHLEGDPVDVLTGTLVHRLFQTPPETGPAAAEDVSRHARALLTADERASLADVDRVVSAALDAWRRMSERPQLARVLSSGEVLHEVPFSLAVSEATPPAVLRGTIDCLVRRPDGSVVVVELKTGRPQPSHEQQLDLYVRAARACFPEAAVERLLVYL